MAKCMDCVRKDRELAEQKERIRQLKESIQELRVSEREESDECWNQKGLLSAPLKKGEKGND